MLAMKSMTFSSIEVETGLIKVVLKVTQGVLYKKALTTCLRITTNDEATKYRAMKGGSEKEAVMERTRAVTQGRCQCKSPSLSVQISK